MSDINMTTLKSGMRLVTVDMPGLNSVTVLAMVGVGSRYEDPKHMGISHFLEHLPFKGTQNYPTAMDLAVAIDGVGGKHNAFTGKEYTGYWVKVGADKLKLGLDVVSDLVLTARLREEDIEREKGVIVEEINMYQDNPQSKVALTYDELVYKGSPLAWDTAGYKETVTAMTRQDFLNHWDKWYDPNHTVLGIVGKLGELGKSGIEALVEEAFAKGDGRKGGGEYVDVATHQTKPRVKVIKKKTEQAHFHLGFPSLNRYDPQRYALTLLATLAGGNSSSRMFNEIREKRGLAYYAYTSIDLNRDAGSFYAFEGVSLEKAQEAIKVTLGEFEKLQAGKITDDELARAKEYVVGKLMLDLEDSARMADLMVERVLFEGEVIPIEEIIARYKKVTLDEIKTVAKQSIDFQKLNLAIIGPFKKDEFETVIR